MPSLVDTADSILLHQQVADMQKLLDDTIIHLASLETHVRNTMQDQIDMLADNFPPVETEVCAEVQMLGKDSGTEQGQPADSTLGQKAGETCKSLHEQLTGSYSLNASIWDAGMFIGIRSLGIQSSIYLGFTMAINVVVQGVFCMVCWGAFQEPDMPDDSEFLMKIWRLNSAHDVANVQAMWPLSLASRVCSSDASLPLSAQQQGAFDAVSSYRPSNAVFLGELMCLMCLLCFWNLLWSDCKQTIKFAETIYLAIGKHTTIIPLGDEIQVQSISRVRGVLCWTTVLFRFAVFVNLGMIGTTWLTQTVSVDDLLFNAVALELILCVDELIYEGLAPTLVKVHIQKCAPLRVWHIKRNFGADVEAMFGMLWVFVLLPVVYFYKVQQKSTILAKVGDVLCGGTQNFVYSMDALGMIHVHDGMAQPGDDEFSSGTFSETDFRVLAVNEVIEGVPREKWKYSKYAASIDVLRQKATADLASAMSLSPDCNDVLTNTSCERFDGCYQYREALRFMVGDPSFEWCSDVDVEQHCFGQSKTALLTKALCPVTCGCASFSGGIYVLGGFDEVHCPLECGQRFHDERMDLIAMDVCLEDEDGKSSTWQLWMTESKPYLPDAIREPLEKQGCFAIHIDDDQHWRDLCLGERMARLLKPLAGVCPRACGCTWQLGATDYLERCPDLLRRQLPNCSCEGVTSIADVCASDSCKNRAVLQNWFIATAYLFTVNSIEDVNRICGCSSLATIGNIFESADTLCDVDNECYIAAAPAVEYPIWFCTGLGYGLGYDNSDDGDWAGAGDSEFDLGYSDGDAGDSEGDGDGD